MRRVCFAALTALLLGTAGMPATPASAQTPPPSPSPEAMQAANELFALLSKEMVSQLAEQITAQVWPLIQRELGGKVDAPTLADLRKEFVRIQTENLADVLKDAPAVYARHFTVSELRDLIAFNRSPTGQKILHETPQIMGEVMATLIPRMQEVQQRTQEAFNKILRERGYIK
jgi:hypothetical protein